MNRLMSTLVRLKLLQTIHVAAVRQPMYAVDLVSSSPLDIAIKQRMRVSAVGSLHV